jgi:hypothetical protein
MSTAIDTAAATIAHNLENTESLLLQAYSENFKDGDGKLQELATNLGVDFEGGNADISVRGLQLIAEQRYQQRSQSFSLFSNILSKADQLKQQIISKLGR